MEDSKFRVSGKDYFVQRDDHMRYGSIGFDAFEVVYKAPLRGDGDPVVVATPHVAEVVKRLLCCLP